MALGETINYVMYVKHDTQVNLWTGVKDYNTHLLGESPSFDLSIRLYLFPDCLYFIINQLTFISLPAICFLSLFLLCAKGHAKAKSKMRGIQLVVICNTAARYH